MTPSEQKAWRDGYTAGFNAANVPDKESEPSAAERNRIIRLISLLPEHTPIPDIIEAVRGE